MISSCNLYTYFLLLLISPLTLSITDDGQDKQFEDDIAKQEIESEIANGDVAVLAENTSSFIAFDNATDLLSQLGKPDKKDSKYVRTYLHFLTWKTNFFAQLIKLFASLVNTMCYSDFTVNRRTCFPIKICRVTYLSLFLEFWPTKPPTLGNIPVLGRWFFLHRLKIRQCTWKLRWNRFANQSTKKVHFYLKIVTNLMRYKSTYYIQCF